MFKYKYIILIAFLPIISFGQLQTEKEIHQQTQSWVSINTVTKFSNRWGIIADAHIRTNEIFKDNSFYFLRGGI